MTGAGDVEARRPRARLRGLAVHLAGYFGVMVILMVLNLAFTPAATWIVVPLVGWGAVLAVHAAYVMGLFEVFRRNSVCMTTAPRFTDRTDSQ